MTKSRRNIALTSGADGKLDVSRIMAHPPAH